jgi:phage gp29-like protein
MGIIDKFKGLFFGESKNSPRPGAEVLGYSSFNGPMARHIFAAPDLAAYRKMRLDGQVSAGLSVVKLPVMSRRFHVVADSDEVAEFVKKTLEPVWRDLIRGALLALDYGFAVMEKVWAEDANGKLVYARFKDPDPESLELEVDDRGNFVGVSQQPGQRIDADKAFLYTHRLEHGNLYGISRLRPAYPYWRTKEIIYLFLNRYLERKGNPPVVVKYPPRVTPSNTGPQTDKNARAALELGGKLLENSAVAVPHDVDSHGHQTWGVSYLEDDPRVAMFLEYIDHLNKMILRSLFVPDRVLTQEAETGSFALAKVHADIFLMSEEGLITDIEAAVNEQIVKPLIDYNFGPEMRSRIIIERFNEQDRELLKDVFLRTVESGEARPAAEELAERLGVPLLQRQVAPLA